MASKTRRFADTLFGGIQMILLISALVVAFPFLLGMFILGFIWRRYNG